MIRAQSTGCLPGATARRRPNILRGTVTGAKQRGRQRVKESANWVKEREGTPARGQNADHQGPEAEPKMTRWPQGTLC